MAHRGWCFTLNNWTQEDLAVIPSWGRYCVVGEEVGDSGTPHLQGYLELPKLHRLGGLKKLCPRAHWEPRVGTRDQARAYCMKDGKFHEFGDWSAGGHGARTDIAKVILAVKRNHRFIAACGDEPEVFKYPRSFQLWRTEQDEDEAPEWRDVHCEVYIGSTGTGKSRKAISENPDYYKLDMANSVWFNGYHGQKTLIIDDFYGWIKYGHLLQLLDGYKMRIEIKGGFTYARWEKVIITSNKAPEHWYEREDCSALNRRIANILNFPISLPEKICEPLPQI